MSKDNTVSFSKDQVKALDSLIAGARASKLEELEKALLAYKEHMKDPENTKNPLKKRAGGKVKDIDVNVRVQEDRSCFRLPPLYRAFWVKLHHTLNEKVPSYKYVSTDKEMTCDAKDEKKMREVITGFFGADENPNGAQQVNYSTASSTEEATA